MVGLVKGTSLGRTEGKILHKKMSDSILHPEDKAEKPLSNGTESKEEDSNGSGNIESEEKMEVDEKEKVEPQPVPDAEPTEAEDTNDKECGSDKATRRKSCSSRSESSNSSVSGVAVEKKKGEEKKTASEEEDFLGFDSDSETLHKVENSLGQYKKASTPSKGASESRLLETPKGKGSDNAKGNADSSETPSGSSKKGAGRGSKKSVGVDLSNPEFRKPFDHGWVRELVYRSTTDNSQRRNADIYYYTPSGKKVRSSREILEHLGGDSLSLDNFTFFKEAIGVDDPTKEIIREAKSKPGAAGARGLEDGTPPGKKVTPKGKVAASQTPKPPVVKEPSRIITPKVVFRGSTSGTPKIRPPSTKSKLDKKRKSAGPDDVDVMVESEEWSPEPQKVNTQTLDSQCSIKCRLALGLIPTLQCATCVCLYHPACMGVPQEKLNKPSFVFKCKNCRVKASKVDGEKSEQSLGVAPSALKLSTGSLHPAPTPTLAPAPAPAPAPASTPAPASPRTGIVGAVTTWFSPSSSIHHGTQTSQPEENTPGIYVNPHGTAFFGFSRNTVVNVNTQEPLQVNTLTNSTGLYLIPCDPQQQNGPQSVPLGNGLKRQLEDSPGEKGASPPEKMSKLDGGGKDAGDARRETEDECEEQNQMEEDRDDATDSSSSPNKLNPPAQNFMMNLNAGFVALLHAFRYLRVYELLRAGQVSSMWQFVASHHSLWETVRMKNSRVSDWKGFAETLSSRGTRFLDLRKMLVPDTQEALTKMWEDVLSACKEIKTLKAVDMGRCTPENFLAMAEVAPQLESLVSMAVKGTDIDLAPLSKCRNLRELKLKTVTGTLEVKDLGCMSKLTNLTTLALTTVKNLKGIENHLPEKLVSLELGECSQLSKQVATMALPKLVHLKRLRLEKGQGDCPTIDLLEAIAGLEKLTQLELINFDIKPGFDKSLAKCHHLRTLLIIPTYVTQSATTNHVVMGGVAKLSSTLNYFIWGLTLELLKVTDLFIGQVENQKAGKLQGRLPPKKGAGDSIPILKPSSSEGEMEGATQAPSQVDILALPNLQRVLSTLLPTTKIKILKVPFSATWRQQVTDA